MAPGKSLTGHDGRAHVIIPHHRKDHQDKSIQHAGNHERAVHCLPPDQYVGGEGDRPGIPPEPTA